MQKVESEPRSKNPVVPDDGARIVETTGVEILENLPHSVPANANGIASEDPAQAALLRSRRSAEVIPFAATLPRVS